VLPSDYTFTLGDAGTHTFTGVVLNSPYKETITVSDTVTPFISASATISVNCPGVCQSSSSTPGSRGTNQSPTVPAPGTRLPVGGALGKARIGVQASQSTIAAVPAAQSAWTVWSVSPIRLLEFALRAFHG
jgi:hypothetical protein